MPFAKKTCSAENLESRKRRTHTQTNQHHTTASEATLVIKRQHLIAHVLFLTNCIFLLHKRLRRFRLIVLSKKLLQLQAEAQVSVGCASAEILIWEQNTMNTMNEPYYPNILRLLESKSLEASFAFN